nr:hypothetical protein GCM10020093_111520 [Planobispora longispora]
MISHDSEEIVRWIGVISYSLPWALAARLSFATYSADPASASQVLVGTTPDVWVPADVDAALVRLDEPAGPARAAGSPAPSPTAGAGWTWPESTPSGRWATPTRRRPRR